MGSPDEQPSKETRKRDWLDWAQGGVALVAAFVAIWINIQQQQLNSQVQRNQLGICAGVSPSNLIGGEALLLACNYCR